MHAKLILSNDKASQNIDAKPTKEALFDMCSIIVIQALDLLYN